jgi:UDP-N-acetylglucosamine:LPS N-acetylglucosamine transferase
MFISSTGGHLSELLQLSPLFERYDYYLVTEKTKSNESLANAHPGRTYYLSYGTKSHLFSYLFKFSFNILKSLFLMIKIRPELVVTTGTHTAVPMCFLAKLFGKKVIFIETFANSKTKTKAGSLVYPIADVFIVQWESMLELYPKAILGGWIY